MKPRDAFRGSVLERDDHKCVRCGKPATAAHHIMERRLFDLGGYHIDNGVSLCDEHHIEAEKTILSAQDLRDVAGIKNIILPKGYHRDTTYDKWGNIIMPNGLRMKGELFYDESVQKILAEVLNSFTMYVKYPRTKHLPWSEAIGRDDARLEDVRIFEGEEVVVTEKMDGENSTIYGNGYFHARSVSGNEHPSQTWIKNFLRKFCYDIPEDWRVCGENLYARHSISYKELQSFFLLFSIWDGDNMCLDWEATVDWCALMNLYHVPVLWEGVFDEEAIHNTFLNNKSTGICEGYVVRLRRSFHYTEFQDSVAKFVRKNHITEDHHNWRMRWTYSDTNRMKKG